MKLIVVTMPDIEEDSVMSALVAENFRVTRIASTGSFWRSGTSTLLIGVEDGGDDDGGEVQDDASAARRAASFVIGTWRRGRGCSSLATGLWIKQSRIYPLF